MALFTHEGREAEELNLCSQKFGTASSEMEGVLTPKRFTGGNFLQEGWEKERRSDTVSASET